MHPYSHQQTKLFQWSNTKTKPHKKHKLIIKSDSVTIIGDFWQPFCVGKKWRPWDKTAENDICSRKTTFSRLSLGGEVVCAANRAVMVWCPGHLREQSPFFLAQKAQKITEYRDTAPLKRKHAELLLKRKKYNSKAQLKSRTVGFTLLLFR